MTLRQWLQLSALPSCVMLAKTFIFFTVFSREGLTAFPHLTRRIGREREWGYNRSVYVRSLLLVVARQCCETSLLGRLLRRDQAVSVSDCVAHPPLGADRPVSCDSVAAATSLFKLYLPCLCSCGGITVRAKPGSLGPQFSNCISSPSTNYCLCPFNL